MYTKLFALSAFAAAVVLFQIAAADNAKIDAILVNFGGVAYYIDNSLVNWPDAKAICESIGTTLATFQTRPKYDSFVNGIFTLRPDYWSLWYWASGVKDAGEPQTNWYWETTGNNISYYMWAPGFPYYDVSEKLYLGFYPNDGWGDQSIMFKTYSVCEYL